LIETINDPNSKDSTIVPCEKQDGKIKKKKTRKESRIYLPSKQERCWTPDEMIRFNQKTKHRSWERFKKFGEGNWEELLLVEVGSKGILNFGYALNFWSRERGGEIGINNETTIFI